MIRRTMTGVDRLCRKARPRETIFGPQTPGALLDSGGRPTSRTRAQLWRSRRRAQLTKPTTSTAPAMTSSRSRIASLSPPRAAGPRSTTRTIVASKLSATWAPSQRFARLLMHAIYPAGVSRTQRFRHGREQGIKPPCRPSGSPRMMPRCWSGATATPSTSTSTSETSRGATGWSEDADVEAVLSRGVRRVAGFT